MLRREDVLLLLLLRGMRVGPLTSSELAAYRSPIPPSATKSGQSLVSRDNQRLLQAVPPAAHEACVALFQPVVIEEIHEVLVDLHKNPRNVDLTLPLFLDILLDIGFFLVRDLDVQRFRAELPQLGLQLPLSLLQSGDEVPHLRVYTLALLKGRVGLLLQIMKLMVQLLK
jgi:hypothetical protein